MEPLSFPDRRVMWSALVPSLADSADHLAARYPLEPHRVAETARDLILLQDLERRRPCFADVAQSLRSRAHRSLNAGVKLIRPRASWEDLVLPPDLKAQLLEAVDRLTLQSCVLDDWGFLAHRTGSRGVRLLFAGPPGTGKTLSAEVVAHALDSDLLVVDVSRVVSKWVGETEKNLSAVFDIAEDSQSVLLFDEADALFSKRTEVSDAHARYANLETAYLLQRLERFEGLAILATNLRQNIDAAFVRRLEFVIEYTEPDRDQRAQLWKRHIPTGAPVASDVNYNELAALYPVVGGVIRNAAVAAAFRAAAEGMPLGRDHFIHAIRREYEKAGKAFPGRPAGMRT
jgi:SpoVK/Ycf46/Vps4 family AAA+-type ATPase